MTERTGWMLADSYSTQLHEAKNAIVALEARLAAAITAREEAETDARRWKGHHDTQVRWKRSGKEKMQAHYEAKLAASEARVALLERHFAAFEVASGSPCCPRCGNEDGFLGTECVYFVCSKCAIETGRGEQYWTPDNVPNKDWELSARFSPWWRPRNIKHRLAMAEARAKALESYKELADDVFMDRECRIWYDWGSPKVECYFCDWESDDPAAEPEHTDACPKAIYDALAALSTPEVQEG